MSIAGVQACNQLEFEGKNLFLRMNIGDSVDICRIRYTNKWVHFYQINHTFPLIQRDSPDKKINWNVNY